MSPHEQVCVLELLRRWLNALTEVERDAVEKQTRFFMTGRKAMVDNVEALLVELGWQKPARLES